MIIGIITDNRIAFVLMVTGDGTDPYSSVDIHVTEYKCPRAHSSCVSLQLLPQHSSSYSGCLRNSARSGSQRHPALLQNPFCFLATTKSVVGGEMAQ